MSILEKLLDGVDVEWKDLGNVATLKRGTTITAKNKTKGNIPVISGGQKPAYYHGEYNREGKTITIAGSGAYAGHILFWNEPIFVSDAFSIETEEYLNIEFIYYLLLNQQNDIYNLKKGVGVPHVYPKDVAKIKIPIPCPENPEKSLEIQREIVRILDDLTEKNTALISELTKEIELRKKQYEHYRDKLLNFNEIGGGNWRILNDISIKISSGGTPHTSSKEYYNGTIPWLRTQEVGNGEIWDTEIKITEEGLKNSSAKMIPKNCIILAMYGATVGKVGINKISLCTNQACANIQLNEEIANYKFIYHFLLSKYEYIKSLGTGSQTNINAQIVKNLKIPVPTMEVQERIVKLLDEYDLANKTIIEELTKEIRLRQKEYEYYRNLLLDFPIAV